MSLPSLLEIHLGESENKYKYAGRYPDCSDVLFRHGSHPVLEPFLSLYFKNISVHQIEGRKMNLNNSSFIYILNILMEKRK